MNTINNNPTSLTYTPERMVRSHVRAAPDYVPGGSPAVAGNVVRLDWNESPFGLSPRAQAAYESFTSGNRYPDFNQERLIAALAHYMGTSPDRVVAGAGLDDVFSTLASATINPGDEVIISDPTFGVYRSLFGLHGATIRNVPLGPAPHFALNPDAILQTINERTKLVIICNPNNPTGTLFPVSDIEQIVQHAPSLVAIDEAYAEFSGVSHLELANRYDNVILFRTLSKFAGLAGYRCGYGVFPTVLMPWIRTATPPFCNLSAVTAAVAIASLEDIDILYGNVRHLVDQRELLINKLNAFPGMTAFPSHANFILVDIASPSATGIARHLAAHGVFVRHFPSERYGLQKCLRVSIGSDADNLRFLDQLGSTLAVLNS